MNRITQIDPAQATGKTKQLLDAVQSQLGIVPNLTRVLANAPAALEGYLNFSGALTWQAMAQTNPHSSRASAVTTTHAFLR